MASSASKLQEQHDDNKIYEQQHKFNEIGPNMNLIYDDSELEAAFQALRLSSLEEALATQNQELRPDIASSNGKNDCSNKSSSTTSLSSSTFSSSNSSTPIDSKDLDGSLPANDSQPKRSKRVLSQLDVNELIQMKISQLESASHNEEDEEKATAKQMKKIHKEISQVFNGQDNQVTKGNLMLRKYLEMFQDMHKQEREYAKLKKKYELLQRDRDILMREKDRIQQTNDALAAEHRQLLEERHADKVAMDKSDILCRKLEGLCRQIHRENKRIKWVEHLDRSRRVAEGSERYEFSGIQIPVTRNDALSQEMLQGFIEQYDIREKHFTAVIRSKDLELQLAQAKLDQQRQCTREESAKVDTLKSQLQESTKTESELRKQLNVYVGKFKQVEATLNKSNALFQTFRKEMEVMAKKGSRLEKINVAIQAKCDTMNRNILEMVEERAKQQSAFEDANKKLLKLEALCRAFQAERTALRKELEAKQRTHQPTPDVMDIQGECNRTSEMQTDTTISDTSIAKIATNNSDTPLLASSTTPVSLSTMPKQSIVGVRKLSIPFSKFRQKAKRQRAHVGIQRSEQQSLTTRQAQ
ncbi:hypothetical protein FBU30_000665 [Linnemannia zychae]|nr:hypothetical protein FBU30_000665 [Linnemannia zychae]